MTTTKAVRVSLLPVAVRGEAFAEASRFRGEFYECLSARRDELFELTDAVLCADGAVKSPVDLTLLPEHRRGHGAMYGGLNNGRIDIDHLRTVLAGLPLPRFDGGRLVLAVDVSPWLRSDAPCSAERLFCHVYGRAKTASQFIPGWPYSFVAVLEPGATSWTAILDAVRLGPVDDATAVTAAQLRGVVERLITAGQWQTGDPDIVIVSDAGYWMKPEDQFTIVTDTPEDAHSDEAPFEVVFHDQGISVHVNIGYVATVYDQSGNEVDCGHQRPLEVLRAWTESAEAAAQRTAESPTLRDMTREHAEHMRWALTRAEAADQLTQEGPAAP